MTTETGAQQAGHEPHEDNQVTLTISTLDGDYAGAFSPHEKLHALVQQTIAHVKLEGEGPWILEYDDRELNQDQTIEQAGLKSGDVLTLNQREGEGASRHK